MFSRAMTPSMSFLRGRGTEVGKAPICRCICWSTFLQELSVVTAVVVSYTWSRNILCSLGPAEFMVVSQVMR